MEMLEIYLLLSTTAIYTSIVIIGATIIFLVALFVRDNSIMDIAYGPLYMVATWVSMYLLHAINMYTVLTGTVVTLWALRLSIRIARRHRGRGEDPRYQKWRNAWTTRGNIYFVVRSYLQVFLLQSLIIGIVSLPIHLTIVFGSTMPHFPLFIAGIILSLMGLSLETLADYEVDRFIARKKAGTEERAFLDSGLFAYCRRPNYLGESLVWLGLGVSVISVPYGFIGLLGPSLIAFIMIKVTGPMLEEQFHEKFGTAYEDYVARVPYFLPKIRLD